ncbi:MAG: Exodeoxyribonuclease 7 large subunit [Alphaproteobacteria bacterium MarineAlpha9_Bin7]|nr:MAG: Exodeoxyribonuclease 7 large subunit [Alphaproteobacteria bacterium MarineAlpha9_Bin7]
MPEPAQTNSNVTEYTVSQISTALKRAVESAFARVRIRGEISGLKRAASGHIYLTLKDEKSVLDGVIWRGTAASLNFDPENGLETIAEGRITTYAARSRYQIVIDRLEPAGTGALLALLEERKKKLGQEGLFDEARKLPLPYLPSTIGVITSPTGAVIRDILHRLRDRCPRRVLLWPVLVQGKGAAEQIAAAIDGFNILKTKDVTYAADLLIVARGGGSVEDLWAFNEEIVVRAAANSKIPLISAVGHETDTTLIDFAADKRAPTPTAAAEIAVPVRADLLVTLAEIERQMLSAITRNITESRRMIDILARGLPRPDAVIGDATQHLDERVETIRRVFETYFERNQVALEETRLRLTHPHERLSRARSGLSFITKQLAGAGNATLKENHHKWRRWTEDNRLEKLLDRTIQDRHKNLNSLAMLLESYSYHRVIERGFAVIRDLDRRPITRSAQARDGTSGTVEFSDEERIIVIGKAPNKTDKTPTAGSSKKNSGRKQGRLL